ncbi:FAD:protein FMN transferase [Gemmatimonadota bacterium]
MTVENGKRSFPSRRDFVALGVGVFVVAGLPLLAKSRRRLIRRTIPLMGTFGEIAVIHRDERYAQGAMDAAFQELRRVEALLTRFSPDSEIGRANLAAYRKPQPVSSETLRVLQESLGWAEASDGAFDPCLASVVALWDVGARERPPEASAVRQLAGHGLYRSLELGRFGGSPVVLFHDEDLGIDLGGIGKGYGVDRAVEVLRQWGIEDGLVNLGGDLYALGTSADGDAWKVGVRSPDDPSGLAATLRMSDRGVATSGDYHQFFEHQGRRYHHLLDPGTGEPTQGRIRSVTVAAESCMAADAGATTAFVAPPEGTKQALRRMEPGGEVVHTV